MLLFIISCHITNCTPFDLFIMFLPVHYYSLFPATLQIVHHLTYLSCFHLYFIHYFLPHYPFDLFIMFLPVRYYSLFPATLQIVHHLTY